MICSPQTNKVCSEHNADLCSVLVETQPTLNLWSTVSHLTYERKAFVIKGGEKNKTTVSPNYIIYPYFFQPSEAVVFIVLGILALLYFTMATRSIHIPGISSLLTCWRYIKVILTRTEGVPPTASY